MCHCFPVYNIYIYELKFKYCSPFQNGFEQWRPVFFVGASVYIVSAIFFIFFGTGEIQKWNFSEKDLNDTDNKQKNGDPRELKDTPLSVVST